MSARKKPPLPAKTLLWSERAIRDLEAIDAFIAADNPGAAARWVERLLEAAEQAAQAPLAGRVVPERERADIREIIVRGYRLVYLVKASEVVVLTVFEGHHLFPDDLTEEP
jgi:addiction module RelE/StbE family toxin